MAKWVIVVDDSIPTSLQKCLSVKRNNEELKDKISSIALLITHHRPDVFITTSLSEYTIELKRYKRKDKIYKPVIKNGKNVFKVFKP